MKFNQQVPFVEQLIVSGGNFLVIAISAHTLQFDEQGKLGLIFILYVATVMVNTVAIYQYASVEMPRNTGIRREKYLASLVSMCAVLVILLSLLFLMSLPSLAKSMSWEMTRTELVLCIIFLILQQLTDFSRRTAYITNDEKRALAISSLTYIPRILLMLVITINSVRDVLVILIGSNVAGLLVFIHVYFKYKNYMVDGFKEFARQHFKASRWFIISGPLSWLWAYIPVFFLGKISGLAAVAVLTSVRSISNVGNILMEVLETSVAAKAGRLLILNKENFNAYISDMAWKGALIWFCSLLVIWMAAEKIIIISIGQQYLEYKELLLYLWCAVGVTFLFRIHSVKIRTMGYVKVVSVGYGVAALVVLLISPNFIILYGIHGAAIAFIVGAASNFAAQVISIKILNYQQN